MNMSIYLTFHTYPLWRAPYSEGTLQSVHHTHLTACYIHTVDRKGNPRRPAGSDHNVDPSTLSDTHIDL